MCSGPDIRSRTCHVRAAPLNPRMVTADVSAADEVRDGKAAQGQIEAEPGRLGDRFLSRPESEERAHSPIGAKQRLTFRLREEFAHDLGPPRDVPDHLYVDPEFAAWAEGKQSQRSGMRDIEEQAGPIEETRLALGAQLEGDARGR